MTAGDDVLFTELTGNGGDLGVITLNRPAALNALNHHMIKQMHANLRSWEKAKHIKAIIIRAAEGRAFCAGGDLRLTYQYCLKQDPAMTDFFREEYELNRYIFHYPKPYIALLDGITFGGGVGISIHGSHRIATERLLFAMPETGIGFFPDVGGTYFLPRLVEQIGFYLGLTGTRINFADCVQLNIAQTHVQARRLPDLMVALAACEFTHDARAAVTAVIQQFSEPVQEAKILTEYAHIKSAFLQTSMEAILQHLQTNPHPLAKATIEQLEKKSPLSLKVSLQALIRGAQLNFDECMQQELRIATRFLLGHDFAEGIRAVIIDKDQQPRWQPASLQAVSIAEVEKYL